MELQNLILGDFVGNIDDKYYLLSLEYYYKTELYDKTFCDKEDEFGYAVPTNNFQLSCINKNALNLYNKLLKNLEDKNKLQFYKEYFSRISFMQLEKEYLIYEEKIKIKGDNF